MLIARGAGVAANGTENSRRAIPDGPSLVVLSLSTTQKTMGKTFNVMEHKFRYSSLIFLNMSL